ncbi:MAG: sugar phosphate isomerase/epimerase, partial [Clostridia bacterium]
MNISFSTLGCPRWSWQEITATAGDLGYQGVEVRGV